MNKEETEKAKEIMNKFMNNEMQRDKLERDCRCGGWKIGDVYKHLELNPSIQALLQYIAQLEQENKDLKEIKGMKEAIELAGMDMKSLLKSKYENEKLEQENKALKKGQNSLMSSRKKWKDRYYKLKKMFNKEA